MYSIEDYAEKMLEKYLNFLGIGARRSSLLNDQSHVFHFHNNILK